LAKSAGLHEDYGRTEEIEGSSDRGFGLVFAVVFAIVALWPLYGGGEVRLWAAGVAGVFGVLALVLPKLLAPLNRLWMKLGMLIQRIVSPIILGILFFLTITPIGLFMRLFGKDFLRLRWDPDADSYWIQREPPGPPPESMENQF
jgi:predicted membrane metal-binding protein